jgi:hypothetical protein
MDSTKLPQEEFYGFHPKSDKISFVILVTATKPILGLTKV